MKRSDPVRFASPADLEVFAARHGLAWQPGGPLPHPASGYYITDRQVTRDALDSLCKPRAGTHPSWDGVVWVVENGRRPARDTLDPFPDDPRVRLWGDIYATGDARLLDRIEELHRGRAAASPGW